MNKSLGFFLFVGIFSLIIFSTGVRADLASCDYDGDGTAGDCIPSGDSWVIAPSGCDTCCVLDAPGPEEYHTARYQDVSLCGSGDYPVDRCVIHETNEVQACLEWARFDLNVQSYNSTVDGWCGALGRCSDEADPTGGAAGCNGKTGNFQYYPYETYFLAGRLVHGCGSGQMCAAGQCITCGDENTQVLCEDGDDNDCDGYTDCEDNSCSFYCGGSTTPIEGATSPSLIFNTSNLSVFPDGVFLKIGSNGVMETFNLHDFYEGGVAVIPPSGYGVFSLSNSTLLSYPNPFAYFLASSDQGVLPKIQMLGHIHQDSSQELLDSFLTNSEKELIVENSSGSVVAVFDGGGNVYLKKYFKLS